jgi:hypothetical protein
MTDPAAARAFLLGEVEALEPFAFVAVAPGGHPFHVVEVTRREDGGLEVRVPGRPRGLPELDVRMRSALRDRGFASEDPADQTLPWAHVASSGEAAVDLLQELLVGVFGEKADAGLDVGHGSHKAEVEARKKLALARTRIEAIVTEILGRSPEQDGDGDYVLPIQEVHVMVAPRAAPDGQIVVRVFAITNVGVSVTPELGLFLARLNFGLMFGRFALDAEHRSIWFDETLLGEQFREEELQFAIRMVASTADAWDDRLKQMFSGATYQEVLAGRTAEAPPPTKPGEGTGLYL